MVCDSERGPTRHERRQWLVVVKVCPWGWVLLHVSLHPLGKLALVSETEACPSAVRLEAGIHIIAGLALVGWTMPEAGCFRHGVDEDRLLESGRALNREYFYI